MPINILSNTFVIKMGGEGHLAFVGVQGPSTFSLNVEFITLAAQSGIPGGKLKWLAWTIWTLLLLCELWGHSSSPSSPLCSICCLSIPAKHFCAHSCSSSSEPSTEASSKWNFQDLPTCRQSHHVTFPYNFSCQNPPVAQFYLNFWVLVWEIWLNKSAICNVKLQISAL